MDDLINEDRDPVAEFIRSKGITRCPTACVLPTQGLIAAADRIALEQHALVRDRAKRERAAARWGRFLLLKWDAELDQRPYKRVHELLRSRGPIAPAIISNDVNFAADLVHLTSPASNRFGRRPKPGSSELDVMRLVAVLDWWRF
jgi:hypothetical protein